MNKLLTFFITLSTLIAFQSFAQTSYMAITNEEKLSNESNKRTIYFRGYLKGGDRSNPIRSTGILLKEGYILTNYHPLKRFLEGEEISYWLGLKFDGIQKIQDVGLIECDTENDLCLLKTTNKYPFPYFSLEQPQFRKITSESPLGLFKGEPLYFNGFGDNVLWKTKKIKFIDYVTNAYTYSSNEHRKNNTPALSFGGLDGSPIAERGDSGGPIFDQNLFLYGLIRDGLQNKNYAVPMNVIIDFVNTNKNKPFKKKLITIVDMPS